MKKGTLLVAFLLTFTTLLHSNLTAATPTTWEDKYGIYGISGREIEQHLADNYGESLFSYTQEAGTSNIIADTKEGHRYLLYIQNGIIIDSVEIPIG